MIRCIWGLLALLLLLAGCGGAASQPTPVAVQPTGTATATATVQPTATATPPTSGSLPPDAEIAFIQESAAGKAVGVTNRNGQTTRQLVPPQATGRSAFLDWSPDGQWLSVVLGTQWWLFARDGPPGQAVSVDRSLGTISRPAWSPDSTRIAFTQVIADRTSTTLTVLDVGSGWRIVYPVDTFEAATFSSAPAWSPDGTTIAVQQTSREPAQSALVLLDVASGQITPHIGTQPRTFSGRLVWSPDSQRLASISGARKTLFVPADQSVVTTADCLSSYINHVTWSPDSHWVAHHHSYNGRYAHGYICVTNLAGETIRINAGGNASNPVWSADSQSLTLAVTTLPESAAFPGAPPRLPDPRLLRFDLATRQLTRITALPQGTGAVVGWIQPSPDQQTIAIAYPRPDPILTLVDPTTTVSTTFPLSVALSYAPEPFLAWSGDADQLFVVTTVTSDDPNQHAGHIYGFDRQNRSFTRLVETGEIVAWAVAPQNRAVAPTATPRPTRTPIPTLTTPAFRISAYAFADADHGWLAIGQKLWHTTDGGTTWQPQFDLPDPAEQIVFTAPQQGWIATTTGYLVTDDGGATWQPTNASGPLHRSRWYREACSVAAERPSSVSFINDQQGWLLCANEPGAGHQAKHVRYTDDGGQTWTTRSDSLPSFGAGANIFFLDAQQGWLTTGLGRVYHTTNGGRSWQPWGNVVIEAVRTKTQPFFLSEQHGFIVFWPNQGTNLLVRTTDGGQSWEQIYP